MNTYIGDYSNVITVALCVILCVHVCMYNTYTLASETIEC